jgi:hypothetical protein
MIASTPVSSLSTCARRSAMSASDSPGRSSVIGVSLTESRWAVAPGTRTTPSAMHSASRFTTPKRL